jgi:hypothetical protein
LNILFGLPRWLSLVERETCNLVVVGSIPTRGFLNVYIFKKLINDYNIFINLSNV